MSAANDNGDRLNQFKNKGKDVNVSHRLHTAYYICFTLVLMGVDLLLGIEAPKGGS